MNQVMSLMSWRSLRDSQRDSPEFECVGREGKDVGRNRAASMGGSVRSARWTDEFPADHPARGSDDSCHPSGMGGRSRRSADLFPEPCPRAGTTIRRAQKSLENCRQGFPRRPCAGCDLPSDRAALVLPNRGLDCSHAACSCSMHGGSGDWESHRRHGAPATVNRQRDQARRRPTKLTKG